MSINDAVMAVCIDGPDRGRSRVIDAKTSYFSVYDPVSESKVSDGAITDLVFDTVAYHVHTISFLGFGIRVASMQLDPSKMDTYDVICCLFNEAARQATYRTNESTT